MINGRVALLVTSATYSDPALTKLRAPVHDAAEMADVLADPEIGDFTVTTLIDRPEREIRRSLATFLASRTVNDVVLVYLSCHGVLDPYGQLYFSATDTLKAELASTAVEARWLKDRMEECRARRQILILDCCHSGAFANTKGGIEVDIGRRFATAGRGRVVLTASRDGEYSFEGQALTEKDPTGSVFTTGLVEGLRTGRADRDGDGLISVEDSYAFAADYVRSSGASQNPQLWTYGGEDPINIARAAPSTFREGAKYRNSSRDRHIIGIEYGSHKFSDAASSSSSEWAIAEPGADLANWNRIAAIAGLIGVVIAIAGVAFQLWGSNRDGDSGATDSSITTSTASKSVPDEVVFSSGQVALENGMTTSVKLSQPEWSEVRDGSGEILVDPLYGIGVGVGASVADIAESDKSHANCRRGVYQSTSEFKFAKGRMYCIRTGETSDYKYGRVSVQFSRLFALGNITDVVVSGVIWE